MSTTDGVPPAAPYGATARTLLAHAVDYAGLFPPAALPMDAAVANYAAYRAGDEAWALGRFVVTVSRLDEFAASASSHRIDGAPWTISAIPGGDVAADGAKVAAFNAAHAGRLVVDMIEGKASTPEQVHATAAAFPGMATFVELAPDDSLDALVAAVRAAGVGAKVRTGGVTAEAFPSSAAVARFIATCAAAAVPWKATAGLHHPVRGEYPLTYAADAARGTMYGYLNIFTAAVLAYAGASIERIASVLELRGADALAVDDGALRWGDVQVTRDAIANARRLLASFGSCSFREPLDELAALTAAPTSR